MKKDFLSKVKGAILTKEEAKTISGGYYGSFMGDCSFIVCGAATNKGATISKPGCPTTNGSWRLYIYKPNPELYCWG
ncbi:hypothetical protein [Flavobacterium silvaticum]|uniref:Uncharacterized protein n=1 Tax=Flavobacterium silvaticum TaxID=1852020 RepID=A0A972FL33_9FLAO|nr:hypothetical protein [Flavobacterium silvaticum]NMH28014.1 hypothetical protein [Flavobacterium silvaticum]